MNTLLRIDTETLPRILVLDPPMSDAEFETLCRENDNVRFERTKEGAIRMHPPAGGWTSSGNFEINRQLGAWWITHERGRAFDSSGGFRLPDGSTLSPDASYLTEKRLKKLPKGALRSFPKVCPDFVIELLSESDTMEGLKSKMADWILNGALLGWLLDPYERQVFVYRPGQEPERITGHKVVGEGPVEGFELNLARVWKCYEDQPRHDFFMVRTKRSAEVLQVLESAARGFERLNAVRKRVGAKVLGSLLAKIQAPPLAEIADMKTLRDVVLGLEQLADSPPA